ncbi:MAG: hypothetical protein V3S37_06675 [Dehalococcoidia bacterium]
MTLTGGEIKNLRLLAHNDLSGFGNGGEGIAIQTLPGGRRIMYIAHERAPKDFTVVDVTDVTNPTVIHQTDLPHANIRSNSLALLDDTLLVAYQSNAPGITPVGMGIYDVSDPTNPKTVSFFDTSGPHSRGVHCLWWVDGKYAHLATGASDFEPTHPRDDQFHMIVDVSDPANPREVGRWWLPGTRKGDVEPPPTRHPKTDAGFRLHNANVYPQRPDRAYLGYLDGGVILLDVSDMSHPKMVSRVDYHPPLPGFTHTVVPLFNRGLLVVTDESVTEDCSDWPKLTWVLDASHESNPVPISTLPLPPKEEFCARPGRFGAHNVHENQPVPTSWVSETIVVGSYFNAGVRVHDITDPFRPEEVAYYIPPVPEGAAGVNINDVYVDENAIIYAVDRTKGGLYILEMEL